MARRRSLNRRWSRRSGNITDLDQDSEVFDTDNPAWWKNLPDATMHGPLVQSSYGDNTEPILSADSLINESELQDRWWDNLDRTNLQSSRRFSTRKSVNQEDAVQESFVSEGDDDVSIKKRKVLLRARRKQSGGGTETFLKAFDDSDVAHSEPPPSKKRKTQSPAKSDADLLARKGRHSRSLADGERGNTSLNTSNDTDIVIKPRPKVFKKRATKISSEVYDEILESAGPSGVDSGKKTSKNEVANTSVIDSNESGFMGPPMTGSLRKKRLSTISKKLDMTSGESEGDAGPTKARHAFQQKSKENASFNPFDEILSGQLDESAGSGEAANKSGRSSNAATRMSKSLKQSQTLRVSMITDAEGEANEASASESQLREQSRTLNEKSVAVEEMLELQKEDRRSTSVLTENLSVAKRRTKNATIEETAVSQWDVPETQEEPRKSTGSTRNSTVVQESVDIDELPETRIRRSPSLLKNNSIVTKRRTKNKTIEEGATSEWDVPETQEDPRKSSGRIKSSTMIEESVNIDELPESREKDRSSSSLSKDNSRVTKRRTKNATIEETIEWELPETQEDPRKLTKLMKHSTMIEESMQPEELPESQENDRKSSALSKRKSRYSKRRTRDETIREATMEDDEPTGFQETSSKSTFKGKENATDSKRRTGSKSRSAQSMQHSTLAQNTRSQIFQEWETSSSDGDNVVNKPTDPLSNISHNSSLIKKTLSVSIDRLPSTRTSHSRPGNELYEESEEEETQDKIRERKSRSPKSHSRAALDSAYELPDKERSTSPIISASESESTNRNVLANTSAQKSMQDKRDINRSTRESVNRSIRDERSNVSRKKSAAAGRSLLRVDSDESIDEDDAQEALKDSAKSGKNLSIKEKAKSRKSVANTNVSQKQESDESISEELPISQKLSLSLSRPSSRPERRTNDSKRSASQKGEESDESISEEEAQHSQKSNLSLSRRISRVEKRIEPSRRETPTNIPPKNQNLEGTISDTDTKLAENEAAESMKTSLRAEDRASTSRGRSARPNVSGNRLESDESISEEESNVQSTNQPSKDKSGASRKSSALPNSFRLRVESDVEEDAENLENTNPDKSVDISSKQLAADMSKARNTTNRNKSSISMGQNFVEEPLTTIPQERVRSTPILPRLPQNSTLLLRKSINTTRTQKNITDFFPSKFLQGDNDSKTTERCTNFEKEELEQAKKVVEMKRQQLAALKNQESAKSKEIAVGRRPENPLKGKMLRPKVIASNAPAKPPKIVDKAYIVNGQVYKAPKLPRPKPWVTDRLYRHLWKQMEPKYDLRTRIKSERFVEQLSEVVALTIRRKKYESYKAEVDALMKEMARLGIVKTRNDFYDFCYDYLPYDFRVKVTPMLLPGNVRNIPYDPATLHTPILPES